MTWSEKLEKFEEKLKNNVMVVSTCRKKYFAKDFE